MTDIDVVALAGKIITEPALPLGVRQRLAEVGAFYLTTSALQKHGPRLPGSAGRRSAFHKSILLRDIACVLADADPRPQITARALLDTLTGYAQDAGERPFIAVVYDAVLEGLIALLPDESDQKPAEPVEDLKPLEDFEPFEAFGPTTHFKPVEHLENNREGLIGTDLRTQADQAKRLLRRSPP